MTNMKRMILAATVTSSALLVLGGVAAAAPQGPTCSDTLGIAVHGQHIVGDYVTGLGHDGAWPMSGGLIGKTVAANGGPAVPGGPGPGFHFPNGVAPGASFCNDSQSPGAHL